PSYRPEPDVLAPVCQVGSADVTAGIVASFDHAFRSGLVDRAALRADEAVAGLEVVVSHLQSAMTQRGAAPGRLTVMLLEPLNVSPIMPWSIPRTASAVAAS